jgi:hypothetical protein
MRNDQAPNIAQTRLEYQDGVGPDRFCEMADKLSRNPLSRSQGLLENPPGPRHLTGGQHRRPI